MASINNYLNFKGNAREAMEFYKSVFGGELTTQTFGESPAADKYPAMKDQIMHANLNGDITLMACDSTNPNNYSVGNAVILTVNCDSPEQEKDWFDKLAVGGKITMPLKEEFWGAVFGSLTDKFGINWMFNCPKKK